MFRITLTFLFASLVSLTVSAGGYSGNKLLEILGEDKNSEAFSQFKTEYLLDKALRNPVLGIKLTASHDESSVVTAIIVTAAGYESNETKYKQFEAELPFFISFNDDAATLSQKFGESKGSSSDDDKMKFKKDGITVNVYFKSAAKKKIAYIKFTQNIGMVGAYRIDGSHEVPPVMLASTAPTPIPAARDARPDMKVVSTKPVNSNVTSLPAPATFGKSSASSDRSSTDPLYTAIMNVIASGEEEMFKDIKKEAAPRSNFWNYKYTYSTSVRIPGEKYNMLYSFPFQNSQLDFVSVLEETEAANPVINEKYREMEAKLKEYFKPSEGWSYHYTVNQEDPKGIKDLELKNPKLGSIVLDHSINPQGKHVLYLRFLLQYT
jgi:hypothetical protein